MTSLIYMSHSYRPRDAPVNDYFIRLLESEDLIPSLDPPSNGVNSAKLERHLGQSDAMVAVLPRRDNWVSPNILYEIALSIRSRKPLLVFVEDTLPSTVLPPHIPQIRYPYRSFPRNTREYRQSITMLRDAVSERPAHYQSLLTPRTCLVIGWQTLAEETRDQVRRYLTTERHYEVTVSADISKQLDQHPLAHHVLHGIDLILAFITPEMDAHESYLLGIAHATCVPVISLTGEAVRAGPHGIPDDYLPRAFTAGSPANVICAIIGRELELYEEDFLDLEDAASAERYQRFLIDLDGSGRYGTRTRAQGVEVVMGDRYEIRGQAAAVGPNAHVHDATFTQLWQQASADIHLPALANELEELRRALRSRAKTPEDDQAVADVGRAEIAARKGDGPAVLRFLRDAGKWAFEIAKSVGVEVAAAAIKSAAGL